MTKQTVANARSVVTKMSSREIAKLTGKRHDNVMADCRKMFDSLNLHDVDAVHAHSVSFPIAS